MAGGSATIPACTDRCISEAEERQAAGGCWYSELTGRWCTCGALTGAGYELADRSVVTGDGYGGTVIHPPADR